MILLLIKGNWVYYIDYYEINMSVGGLIYKEDIWSL